ncbi:hypothetical protein H1C71_021655, partial [Ictidomys tridecemlineatus]
QRRQGRRTSTPGRPAQAPVALGDLPSALLSSSQKENHQQAVVTGPHERSMLHLYFHSKADYCTPQQTLNREVTVCEEAYLKTGGGILVLWGSVNRPLKRKQNYSTMESPCR